jgi:hypothetical protein
VCISILGSRRRGTSKRRIKTQKGIGASPSGHDYRQPKLEEGADAFWQER